MSILNSTFLLDGKPLERSLNVPGLFFSDSLQVIAEDLGEGRFEALVTLTDEARERGGCLPFRSLELQPPSGYEIEWASDLPPASARARKPHVIRQRGAIPLRGWIKRKGGKTALWSIYQQPFRETFAGATRLPCAQPRTPLTWVGPYPLAGQPRGDEPGGESINPYGQHARPSQDELWRLFDVLDATVRRTPVFGVPMFADRAQYALSARAGITDHTGKKLASGVITGSWPWPPEAPAHAGCDYEDELLRWLAPDGQHLIRAIWIAEAVNRWTGSLIARELLRAVARDAALAWRLTPFEHQPWNPKTLLSVSQTAREGIPHSALDREFAWATVAFCAAGEPRAQIQACADVLLKCATPDGIPLAWSWAQCKDTPRAVYWTLYGASESELVCPSFELSMLAVAADRLARILPERRDALSALIRRMAKAVWGLPLVPSLYGGSPTINKTLRLDPKTYKLIGGGGPGESPNPLAILGLGLAHGERSLVRVAKKVPRPKLGSDADSDAWALPLACHYPSLVARLFS